MQYQRSKPEQKEQKNRKPRSPEYIIDSDLGEMNYQETLTNQFVSPIFIKGEQSIDTYEHASGITQPSLQGAIVQIKNELKNRMDMTQFIKENPIESLEVNITTNKQKLKSPKTINIGSTKEEIKYNIKTLNTKKSPKNVRTKLYQTISDNLLDKERTYLQNDVQIQGLPDYRNKRQIPLNPKGIILKSPNAPKRFRDFVYLPNDKSEENICISSNQMSPNINYEEMNNSGSFSRKNEEQNLPINYLRTKNGNILTSKPNQQMKQSLGKTRFMTNLSASENSFEELQDKLKRSNNNITVGEIKRIMRRFIEIYDPSKNNNGTLLGSTQITISEGQDEQFNKSFIVLDKMNRLSNILLSNKNRNSIFGEKGINILFNKSKSRNQKLSRKNINKSTKEKSKKSGKKSLYISLAKLSSKGANNEDRVILRKMRMEKGGVIDLAIEKRKKVNYKIKQINRGVRVTSFLHLNPKYKEKAAKIIQNWWKELKVVNSDILKKIISIQSIYRGKWVRKNMYDLLYLNYLYICFCQKIEKVLLSKLRPYVFGILFYNEKQRKNVLINLINKKEENKLRPYWIHWLKLIKSQYLLNEASRRLVQIRANKENKLSILLTYFDKWKYIYRTGQPSGSFENADLNQHNENLLPSNKLNDLYDILDASNKYAKKKAMDKILNKVLKFLNIQAKKNKYLKKFY